MTTSAAALIKAGRLRLKLTQEEFGEKTGTSRAAVSLWENGSTLPDRARAFVIASLIGEDVGKLLSQDDARFIKRLNGHGSEAARFAPVYRTIATNGADQHPSFDFWITEEIVDKIQLPNRLSQQNGLRWLHMESDSMEPRYYRGETMLVGNAKPYVPLDHIAIVLKDDSGPHRKVLVRRFLERQGDSIRVCQYNPRQEATIALADIAEILRIIPTGEQNGS